MRLSLSYQPAFRRLPADSPPGQGRPLGVRFRGRAPFAISRAGAAGMASGQVADYGQQAVAADKLLPEKDLCFRIGEEAA